MGTTPSDFGICARCNKWEDKCTCTPTPAPITTADMLKTLQFDIEQSVESAESSRDEGNAEDCEHYETQAAIYRAILARLEQQEQEPAFKIERIFGHAHCPNYAGVVCPPHCKGENECAAVQDPSIIIERQQAVVAPQPETPHGK